MWPRYLTEQGGYYLPGGKEKGSTPSAGDLGVEYPGAESAKFDVKTDLLEVVKDMRKRNVPTFADGYYRCICGPHRNDAPPSEL